MTHANSSPPDVGSARSPIPIGKDISAYRRRGKWHYRTAESLGWFDTGFVQTTDPQLVLEMVYRTYREIYPAHECVDRPGLPCPACERDGLQAIGVQPKGC